MLKKNYIQKQQVTLIRIVSILFNIKFETKDSVKSTLNKTTKLRKIFLQESIVIIS